MDVIGANLMAEAARATMDLNDHLAREKARLPAGSFIKELVNYIDLDKMITGAQGAHLGVASFFGPVADSTGVGTRYAALLFGVFQIGFGGKAPLQGPA